MKRPCFDLAEVHTDNLEGERTYEKYILDISHSKGSYRNWTATDPGLHFCVRLPCVVIYSLAGSPSSTKSVPARHISKVLQSSFSLLADLDHM